MTKSVRVSPARRHVPWVLAWAAVSLVGCVAIAQTGLTHQRAVFEADAQTAHSLLSQKAAQLEMALKALTGLVATPLSPQAPGSGLGRAVDERTRAELRLLQLHPEIVAIQRREAGSAWTGDGLAAPELESRRAKAPVLADINFAKGRYQLVLSDDVASYALLVDLRALVPWQDWPFAPATSPVRVSLEYARQTFDLQTGASNHSPGVDVPPDSARGWLQQIRQPLNAPSQPFVLDMQLQIAWAHLPWSHMVNWSLAIALLLLAARALLRQRHDRHRAEERARLGHAGSLNSMSEIASTMVKELGEPITKVLNASREATLLLENDPPHWYAALDVNRQITADAQRAHDMAGHLKQAIQAPDLGEQLQAIPLRSAARNALDLVEPELARLGVIPKLVMEGADVSVLAAPAALAQVVHNLLINALQALAQVPAPERHLTLVLNPFEGRGRLIIQDTGPGLANNVVAHIFDPFFSTRQGALGLGLTLCHTLCSAMGGTVTAFNHSPRGAEFCVSLPLSA
jgi:signal transduction histidine kinase